MTEVAELSELRQRFRDAQARLREAARDEHGRYERASKLLGEIEKGVARGHHELEDLSDELLRAHEENQQLRSMLLSLLMAAETGDRQEIGETVRELSLHAKRLFGGDAGEPLELTRMITESGAVIDVAGKKDEPAGASGETAENMYARIEVKPEDRPVAEPRRAAR